MSRRRRVALALVLLLVVVVALVAVVRPRPSVTERSTGVPVDPPVVELTAASFNVLGSTHTRPRGNRSEMDSADVRMRGVLDVLEREDVDLVGFQELLRDQQRLFADSADGWVLWPGPAGPGRAGEASVAWRADTWRLEAGSLVEVPDTDGAPRLFPRVRLLHRATGVPVELTNYHHPADTRRHPRQEPWREAARRRLAELARETEEAGVPQLVTGDMNARGAFYCAVTRTTSLTTGAGGSHVGDRCRPPAEMVVDWVLGSPALRWTGYAVVRDPLVRRTTDHAVVVASARIDAADFPDAGWPGAPTVPDDSD